MSGIVFRPMDEADLDAVASCEAAAARFPWSRQNFADALASGYAGWLLLDAQGALIGQGLFMSVLDEAHILILSVRPEMQGQGHGRRLLEHLCERARLADAAQVYLEVRPSNHVACALYERAGFSTIGRRKAYYPDLGGQREDALVMRRVL